MEDLGEFFGLLGLICVIYLASRLVLQLVIDQLRKSGKTLPTWLKKGYQFITKTHRYVGFVAVGSTALHIILRFIQNGNVPVTGLISGLALAVQAILGFGLTKQKDKERRKKMALVHRAWGMVIVVTALVHRLS